MIYDGELLGSNASELKKLKHFWLSLWVQFMIKIFLCKADGKHFYINIEVDNSKKWVGYWLFN